MTFAQKPNLPLTFALVGWLLRYFTKDELHIVGQVVFTIFIAIWAYDELRHGVNWFRKLLGAIVFIGISISLFNQLK